MNRFLMAGLAFLFALAIVLGGWRVYVTSRSAKACLRPWTTSFSTEQIAVRGRQSRIDYYGLTDVNPEDLDRRLSRFGWRLTGRGWGSCYQNVLFPHRILFVDFNPYFAGKASAREDELLEN